MNNIADLVIMCQENKIQFEILPEKERVVFRLSHTSENGQFTMHASEEIYKGSFLYLPDLIWVKIRNLTKEFITKIKEHGNKENRNPS